LRYLYFSRKYGFQEESPNGNNKKVANKEENKGGKIRKKG